MPSLRMRLVIASLLGMLAGHFTYVTTPGREFPSDFAQLWYGSRVVLDGGNPYDAIGPGRAFEHRWPLYYPLPSVIAATPVGLLPYRLAVTFMATLGLFALSWALMRHGYPALIGLASIGVYKAIYLVQWSPIFAGGLALAPLSVLWVAKPTVGLACFIARPTRWAVWGGLVLVAVAFIVDRAWPIAWLAALDSPNVADRYRAGHFAAVQFPGGFLVLAALTRWRRWEARLLLALACVPQTMLFYETVLLLLIPRGWRESILFTALTWVALWWVVEQGALTFAVTAQVTGRAITLALYLPATLMVLRRPNEGPVHVWFESLVAPLPAWLRGRAPANA
jgi:hypothetical protein